VFIATWNVNSIRARHDLLLDWLQAERPDVVCLQETKVVDDDFPTDEIQRLGYAVAMAGQKTYNGVAILSRLPMKHIAVGLGDAELDKEKRCIAATINGVRIFSVYVPNGKSVEHADFGKKLRFLSALEALARQLGDSPVAICGDYNIAPDARDVYDLAAMEGQLHFHPKEHEALARFTALGFVDAFRLHHDEGELYSWWDYRGGGFPRNHGLRIDLILLSANLKARCVSSRIDVEPRHADKPSDHTPVIAEISD
jgi:exodeoxyribonuclease III